MLTEDNGEEYWLFAAACAAKSSFPSSEDLSRARWNSSQSGEDGFGKLVTEGIVKWTKAAKFAGIKPG
jgi:hypothetical protein